MKKTVSRALRKPAGNKLSFPLRNIDDFAKKPMRLGIKIGLYLGAIVLFLSVVLRNQGFFNVIYWFLILFAPFLAGFIVFKKFSHHAGDKYISGIVAGFFASLFFFAVLLWGGFILRNPLLRMNVPLEVHSTLIGIFLLLPFFLAAFFGFVLGALGTFVSSRIK